MSERPTSRPEIRDDRGWFDRLVALIEGHRLPWWLLLVLVYLVVAIPTTAAFWIDGSAPVGTLGRPAIDAFYPAYGLFMLLYLVRSGRLALERFAPALHGVAAETVSRFRRRLTSLPDRQTLLGFLIGAMVAIATVVEYLTGSPPRVDVMGATPLSNVLMTVAAVFGYGLALVGVVFIISVLTTIPDIHRAATTIDIRKPGPAHAFAPLTARAGILMIILVAYSAATDPATFGGANLPLAVALAVLATVAFVAPLLGMRRRLAEQKERSIDESDARIGSLEVELERTVDARELDRIRPLTDALAAYYTKRDRIARESTMPWDTATLRGFGAALLIPIATWLATTFLGQILLA